MKSNNLSETLARLKKLTNQSTKLPKINYWKAKQGKNNLLVLPSKETGDPFLVFGEHKNLIKINDKDLPIQCVKHNNGEECIICNVVDELKKSDFKGNKDIWSPIQMKTRYYSPVIDLDELEKGIQWWSYGQTVLAMMTNWLTNLEEDEKPFYDLTRPERVIVSYDQTKDPTLRYTLDKKLLKNIPDEIDINALIEEYTPLSDFFDKYRKSDDDLNKLLTQYLDTARADVEEEENGEEGDIKSSQSKSSINHKNDDDNDEPEIEKTSSKKPWDDEDDDDDVPKLKKLAKK